MSGTYGTIKDEKGVDYIPKPEKLGAELTIEDGYELARLMVLNHLAMAKSVLGDLVRIDRPIRLVGYVNAAPGFQDAPSVLNGASDLLIKIFGEERGTHARVALYQHELARNAPIASPTSSLGSCASKRSFVGSMRFFRRDRLTLNRVTGGV